MRRRALKKDYLLVAILLVVALTLRLYKINIPLADLNSWRQAETATVASHFAKDGIDLLNPESLIPSVQHKDVANIFGRGIPLYEATIAGVHTLIPALSVEMAGRTTTIIFSLILLVVIYYIVFHEVSRTAAFFASLIFAVFPFFVFFSRVVLPEMTAVSLIFVSLIFLHLFARTQKKIYAVIWYILSMISAALAIVMTPQVVFYLLAAAFLFGRRYQLDIFKKIHVYLYFILVAAPYGLWYLHIQPPVALTPAAAAQSIQDLFFKPGFFKSIFFDRISSNMLGGYLTAFLVLGIVARPKKYFLHSLLVSVLVYLFLFQGANISYEYYQILLLPVVATLVGTGIARVVEGGKGFITPAASYPMIIFLLALSFYITYDNVKGYYSYSPQTTRIASILGSITASSDKIVTDTDGDTTLLYLAHREGTAIQSKTLLNLKNEGYSYFVSLDRDVIQNMKKEKKHPLVFEDQKNFAIFKL